MNDAADASVPNRNKHGLCGPTVRNARPRCVNRTPCPPRSPAVMGLRGPLTSRPNIILDENARAQGSWAFHSNVLQDRSRTARHSERRLVCCAQLAVSLFRWSVQLHLFDKSNMVLNQSPRDSSDIGAWDGWLLRRSAIVTLAKRPPCRWMSYVTHGDLGVGTSSRLI
ncbi:hypothetical protein BD309DRAFT_672239 [Dichomitus squalens]|nr:hypothetical protein BD309DRAFT_672239 [Dichomitus squalens]